MLYFMQPTTGGPIKIGHSGNVERRRQALEMAYGVSLDVLFVMPGGRPEEIAMHRRFSHLRFGQTEQFRPGPDLLEFIGCGSTNAVDHRRVHALKPKKVIAVQIRGSSDYKKVVREFARADGKSDAALIDHAIRFYAKQAGFSKAIPRRQAAPSRPSHQSSPRLASSSSSPIGKSPAPSHSRQFPTPSQAWHRFEPILPDPRQRRHSPEPWHSWHSTSVMKTSFVLV